MWAMLAAVAAGAGAVVLVRRWTEPRLNEAVRQLEALARCDFDGVRMLDGSPEHELMPLFRQIQRTARALEAELEQLKKRDHYRREFVGNVSHELKTPIFALQGYAETLLNGALDDPAVRRSFVEKIRRNANRLDRLAGDLMEIIRIETGELEMTFAPFGVSKLLEEAIEVLNPLASEKKVDIALDAEKNFPSARGDRERIQQVVVNLIDNAIKYSRKNGRVTVRTRRNKDEVEIAVEDTGIGIEASLIPRLTERFYRVDAGRSRNEGGTGLGLAIVKHILLAHGSMLQIESELGVGSTFAFSLPVGEAI